MSLQNHPIDTEVVKQVAKRIKEIAPKADRTTKMNEETRLHLISLIAHCYSNAEIQKEMFEKHGKIISTSLIGQYQRTKKWREAIKKIRQEYELNVPEAKMFSKRSRLDRLERIYDRAVEKEDIDNQLKAVSQGWREIEGNKQEGDTNVYLNNPVYNQLNLLSNEELLRRHKEATEKLRRINGPVRETEEDKE